MSPEHAVTSVDPFDLPDWVGSGELTWTATTAVRGEPHVGGSLDAGDRTLACDLLAADLAYPRPVLDEEWRRAAHQAWTHGQVLLLEYDGRLTLAVPGTRFSADLVLETLGRLGKAVGATAGSMIAALRL